MTLACEIERRIPCACERPLVLFAPDIRAHDEDVKQRFRIVLTELMRLLQPEIKPVGLFGAYGETCVLPEVACRELDTGIVRPGTDPGFDRDVLQR